MLTPASMPAAWRGIAEWTQADGLWQPWRIPRHELETCQSAELTEKAMIPNGGRIVITTDATAVSFECTDSGCVDVFVNGSPSTHPIPAPHIALGPGTKTVELWLPHAAPTRIGPLVLADATFAEPGPVHPTRWIAYGSSITQCSGAPSPARTWPALVSRALSWELTALGMAGQCHLDPAIARLIADTPADLICLCLGINIYSKATFSDRSLVSAVTGFIRTIRCGHPGIPLVVMTPIISPDRENQQNQLGLTLAEVRSTVTKATDVLIRQGDPDLTLIHGNSILSHQDHHLLADGLHPSATGYEHMAHQLTPVLEHALH